MQRSYRSIPNLGWIVHGRLGVLSQFVVTGVIGEEPRGVAFSPREKDLGQDQLGTALVIIGSALGPLVFVSQCAPRLRNIITRLVELPVRLIQAAG